MPVVRTKSSSSKSNSFEIMQFKIPVASVALGLLLTLQSPDVAEGQFFNAIANLFRPLTRVFRPRFRDDGTRSPQATGREEINPSDCGRNPNDGTGKLCFPDGILCQNSKTSIVKFIKKSRG